MSDLEPEERPFGETYYRNYDPDEINTVRDAVELFEWISDENRKRDKSVAASTFEECADVLRDCLIEEDL